MISLLLNRTVYVVAVAVLAALFMSSCDSGKVDTPYEGPIATAEDLAAHSEEFRKAVVRVTDRVHVAVGYGLANSILIEGEDGLIVIDAMASMQEGEAVLNAFRAISDKPLKAIIYTHNHTDHVFGAQSIAQGSDPMVIAHETMPYHLDRIATVIRPIIEKRSYRMFGNLLTDEEIVNCGIGSRLLFDKDTRLGVIRPTLTFSDSLYIEISGVKLQLYHAPGETPDQIFVWMPADKVLFCGDNFYKAFPNLYTIRGTAYRDLNLWKNSLDHMRSFPVEHLVPSHSRPLAGAETVRKALTDYRDAIQFVHDQTVRYMNKGYTPDEIVERVRLPEHLASRDYLQEFYGRVDWTVRSVFSGYLGWFDGNPSTLMPLSPEEISVRMADLAGGVDNLRAKMSAAAAEGDLQWALQLSDHVLRLEPDDQDALILRRDVLLELGMDQSNPNARHYLVTAARELEGLENEQLVTPDAAMVHSIPMLSIFNGMATFLDAEKARDVNRSMVFDFTDTGEQYSVIVRRGVAEIRDHAIEDPDHVLTTTSDVWKEIAAEIRQPLPAFLSGKVKVDGGKVAFLRFMDLFDR